MLVDINEPWQKLGIVKKLEVKRVSYLGITKQGSITTVHDLTGVQAVHISFYIFTSVPIDRAKSDFSFTNWTKH